MEKKVPLPPAPVRTGSPAIVPAGKAPQRAVIAPSSGKKVLIKGPPPPPAAAGGVVRAPVPTGAVIKTSSPVKAPVPGVKAPVRAVVPAGVRAPVKAQGMAPLAVKTSLAPAPVVAQSGLPLKKLPVSMTQMENMSAEDKMKTLYLMVSLFAKKAEAMTGHPAPVFTLGDEELRGRLNARTLNVMQKETQSYVQYMKSLGASSALQMTPESVENFSSSADIDDDTRSFVLSSIGMLADVNILIAKRNHLVALLDKQEEIEELRESAMEREEEIRHFAAKIEKKGFPVDAYRLVKNYLQDFERDPRQAFHLLTTNPVFYSPIDISKLPKRFFGFGKPDSREAVQINKSLGAFLKKIDGLKP